VQQTCKSIYRLAACSRAVQFGDAAVCSNQLSVYSPALQAYNAVKSFTQSTMNQTVLISYYELVY